MRYNTLATTDIKVSELSLGCMSFHTEQQGRPIIETALDQGINFFDTADLYDKGENERILGKVLANNRQDVIIASKVGNRWKEDGSAWDWVPHKKYILSAVEASLSRLKTDYIDLYQLHGGTIEDPLEEVVEIFEMLKDQGKIRAYGISSIRPNTIRKWTRIGQGATCMSQYSLLDRRPEEFILDHLQENKQQLLVRGGVAKGLLAGKTAKKYLNRTKEEVALLQAILQKSLDDRSLLGFALHFVLAQQVVASCVLGASNAKQLKTSVLAYEKNTFSIPELRELSNLFELGFYEKHR